MSGTAPRPAGLREGWTALACAVVAIGLSSALIPGGVDFGLDDAWIHLVYAESLRAGQGPSYNPGAWETGFSSPLWVLALAAWPTSQDPVVPVKLLGALCHGATAFLASTLALELARARARLDRPVPLASIGLLAGVLAAASPTLLQGAVSGMEVALAAATLLASALALVRGARIAAAATAAAAVLARPEGLFFVLPAALALGLARRDRAALWAAVGAAAAMLAWNVYCLAVSGHPWPNARYVKSGAGLSGLSYLGREVLPWQPWLVGIGGVVLIGLALRGAARDRQREPWALVAGLLGFWIGTALSRPLHVGVLFYESRYFAPAAVIPAVLLAQGLIDGRRALVGALVVPVALVTSLQIGAVREQLRAQELDVWQLHTAPARHAAAVLPPDAVLAVEGAGALRYFTPRSIRVVDVIGLNDGEIARAPDDVARACVLLARAPTHFVLPEHIAANLDAVFELELLRAFDDESYAQIRPPHPMRVLFLRGRARPAWRERCAARAGI
jgi:hypothetical protein